MKLLKLFLMFAILGAPGALQAQDPQSRNSISVSDSVVPDTIVRTDTITVTEVITRTDIIHRTEKIIRYEGAPSGSSFMTLQGEKVEPLLHEAPAGSNDSLRYFKLPDGSIISTAIDGIYTVAECPAGGNFIWVPDSLDKTVMDILHGKSLAVNRPSHGDSLFEEEGNPNEKVTFRGDTIPMILKDRNLGRFDRGLFNYLFIPKGIWQIGLTASYGEFSTKDLEILDLVSDIDFYGHIFSVRPYFSYFLKNNISLGLRLGYTSGKAAIGSFNLDIDEDMSFSLHDIMYKSSNYSAAVTLTQYLGITRKGRFGVFNEVELAFAGGSSDFHRPFNGDLRRTHTSVFQIGLNFSPGLCVYIIDPLSFNVSFGVFGLNLKHEKQKVNDEPMGERTTSGANFRFNIFNINFGIAVNI